MTAIERLRAKRPGFWQLVFLGLLVTGVALTFVRYTQGLGAVTNLSDRYPWGLWVGFDLLCGVGLAAGGFVVTGIVYIFNMERWRPIVRATLLTAYLGYLLVTVALLFDIGRPWNIWHPLVMWNPHSVMFEVAWCVTLYSTVLTLEFSGMVFERLKWLRALKIQKMVTVPLVILGVILSTLHQSSLGTVYLIVPGKLHPIWYSSLLPVFFFMSAVAVGLAMVIVESKLSSRAFGRQLEMPLLSELGRALVGVLALYGFLRIFDFWRRDALQYVLTLSYESALFYVEFLIGVVAPAVLLAFPKIRRNTRWLYGAALLAVLGFITNRLNVSITGFEGAQGGHYLPSLAEGLITLFLVALGFAGFAVAVKHFNIFPEHREELPEAVEEPAVAEPVRVHARAVAGR